MARQDFEIAPILLIDEAETHLHYDAQADMVNLFTEQTLADKVIYTTHSAGCLPRDMGNGIRVVVALPESQRSELRNSVWSGRGAGFTPLVFGMGATTFAFLPARNVLIVEGDSDAILLPTLMREAMNQEALPFQVVPGLASTCPARYGSLLSEGGSVVFMVDGDVAGEKLACELKAAGIERRRVFSLSGLDGENTVLEDLVDTAMLARAATKLISTYNSSDVSISPNAIEAKGFWNAISDLTASTECQKPGKVALAQELIDIKFEAVAKGSTLQLLRSQCRSPLKRLCNQIVKQFPDVVRG